MSTPKDYSSMKYIISQPLKTKQSFSLPKDYSSHHNKNHIFVRKKNLSTCELITTESNDDLGEEIYLDQDDIDEMKNGFIENNEADLSDESDVSLNSSLISVPATISLLERLIRTHPIWLLTNLERTAVNHLLQNKDPGNFIVRSSSKIGTMALSVRLPKGKGPHIEHYLIENLGNRKLHLEGSERYFSVIPMLICHYCEHLDELPVLLKLPDIILNASRHQLNSLSLLSDKFWLTSNFEEQIYSLSETDEQLHLNKNRYFKKQPDDKQIDEPTKNDQNHKNLSLNRQSNESDRLSTEDDRNSIETKELFIDTEDDEDADHHFIKNEVFSSESCDNQEGETEIKKHFLMDDDNLEIDRNDEIDVKTDEKIENHLDELINLKLNNNDEQTKLSEQIENDKSIEDDNKKDESMKDEKSEVKNNESNDLPIRPPRKTNISQPINISPPPLPERALKPVAKQYFKLSSVTPSETTKSIEENNRKKSVASNLNLLIDFDVFEEEEKLIQQLKENDIFNLNVINAQTQQMMMSSKMSNQLNSDSSIELLIGSTSKEPLLNDQMNITKIEVNTCTPTNPKITDNMQEKLDELNLIELKLNESREELEDELQTAKQKEKSLLKIEPLIVESMKIEQVVELKPSSIDQQSSPIQPLIAQKLSNESNLKPNFIPKQRSKVETRDCEVQTDLQSILDDLKLERYRNFLVYDFAPNLKLNNQLSKELSMFSDPIYSTKEDLVFYQHFLKRNLSNPNLNQLTTNLQLSTKNIESHSFESLYVTYDSVYAKQTHFFERYIVPRKSNLSDVCVQVGDGNLRNEGKSSSRRNSIRTELINSERVKLVDNKKHENGWQVDKSWEYNESSEDEELTNSIVNNENISTKFRRYSCKYIIESGVETDSDGEVNENGLQSMLQDNVRLDGFKLDNTQMNGDDKVKRPNLANNVKKNTSPLMLIDNEEPCSSGFFETTNNINNNRPNEIKQIELPISSTATQQNSKAKSSILQKQKNEETENEDELVFQEITYGLDDVYTTNDELDDNQSEFRAEDIYTVTARNVTYSTVAKSISEYIFELHRFNDNVFARSINKFISCTKELYESNPLKIMRNIRQFINGMKNYLIKNGEKEFLDFVKHERKRLKAEEFLNLEAIITACLHKLVIKPLKEFIYQKFVSMEYRFGYESYMKLNENISFLASRLPEEFEIQNNVRLPSNKTMKRIGVFFNKLQNTYSPLKKLEYILSIVSIINFNTKIIDKQPVDGKIILNKQRIDDRTFQSVFIYLLVKFNIINIEIEIDYICSLVQQNLVHGDAAYYLTMLSSCVYILKCNFSICQERNYSLNTVELQRSMITSYLPSLNDSINAKCKLSLFQKEISSNLVLPRIIDHPDLNIKNLKNSKKRNHTFNQNINELTLVNSNFVQSYPLLNNYRQDSFFRTAHILQNNDFPLKLSSLFTICCLKILILDEFTGNINCKLIVIRPEMCAKEFSKLIAQKFSIFNPEDYSLFLLTQEGKEFQIDDNELPFSIKINAIKYGMNLSFVFKRSDSQYVFSNKFYELNHFESFGLI